MKEPKRLLSQGATDFERQLLRAVVNERPSALLRSRMQRGLGLVGPLAWASTVKAMLGGLTRGAAGKVTGLVALGVLAAAGVTAFSLVPASSPNGDEQATPSVASPLPAESASAPTEPAPPPAVAEAVAPAPAVAPDSTVTSASNGETTGSAGPGAPVEASANALQAAAPEAPAAEAQEDRQLREEIALLDAARGALERGDRQAARDSLRSYRERFPSGILAREASVLRRRAEPPRARPRPER